MLIPQHFGAIIFWKVVKKFGIFTGINLTSSIDESSIKI